MNKYTEKEYSKQFDFELWKKLYHYAQSYKKELFILAVVMVGVAGIDVVFPVMTKYAIDNFIVTSKLNGLKQFAFIYAGLVILQSINIWVFINQAGKIEMGISYDIRKKGFEKLQELSLSFFDKTPVGWLMARMISDIRRLSQTISWGLVDSVWGLTMMMGIMFVMFYFNWKLALITLSVVPLLIAISIIFQKKILKAYRKVRKTNSKITGAFNEGIMGARTTKILVREVESLNEFKELTEEMRYSSVRAAIFSALFLPVVMTLGSIGTGLALWRGGNGVFNGVITYGTLVLFVNYTVQFFHPVRELARVFAELQSAQASAERVFSMIETDVDIVDSSEVVNKYGDIFETKEETWEKIKGDISFKNVSFSYKGGEKVLEDFNLDVKAGESVALVGETGSGKSTIVNIACRFYEPTEGRVLIDGVDYRQRSQLWLHKNIGYVLQDPQLFNRSIRENIGYGKLDATDEEIIKAAKIVNAHQFISKLKNAYDSEVGEGGGLLSTGEKQLISFARAIISDPKIFVLDEATSSIDTEMEQLIQDAIDKIMKGRTTFIIAHRLSTIRSANRIIVLRNGQIKEEGTHQELLSKGGYYYSLYTNQFLQENDGSAV